MPLLIRNYLSLAHPLPQNNSHNYSHCTQAAAALVSSRWLAILNGGVLAHSILGNQYSYLFPA